MRVFSRVLAKIRRRSFLVLENIVSRLIKAYASLIGAQNPKIVSLDKEVVSWFSKDFTIPSPPQVKRLVLLRHGIIDAPWIETGTYLGQTTTYLSKHFKSVTTIEPNKALYERASDLFNNNDHVNCVFGSSEDVFQGVLDSHSGDLNIFLDGHYSGGVTSRTQYDTPVILEIDSIIKSKTNFRRVNLFIDDVRCMNPKLMEYENYPRLSEILDMLEPYSNSITIEHDILVARLEF